MENKQLEESINAIIENPKELKSEKSKKAVYHVIECIDNGSLRVSSKEGDNWKHHNWVRQSILYYFQLQSIESIEHGPFSYHDKIPLKKNFRELKVRAVPPAVARYGSFMEENVVLMPSYVNIGARVGSRTMVDTWATVGSCAQIGKDVHLSGGVGIGGVLEPVGASPVIIEDGVFIGSRSIIVEGVRIDKEAVLAANCTITASTPIIDTRTKEFKTYKGYIPPRSVVLPGVREKEINGGKIFLGCAYIIGERKESTNLKTSLNDTLREYNIAS